MKRLDRLEGLRGEIDAHIDMYMQELPAKLGVDVSQSGELVLNKLREFALRPGKRIRGALAIISYEMFGGAKRQTGLDLALAVELVQDYLLIVDDVMDRSELRRGSQTIHRQYQELLRREYPAADAEHIGNMIGVNLGLISQHLSVLVLSGINEAPERVLRAERLFQSNIAATGFGQMDDLMNEAGQAMTLDDVRHMYRLKSSYYSFVNPLQVGAVLAGAADSELASLREYGEYAGMAFQLQDDLLGMFGDEHDTGKSSLDDLREGKMTLLVRHGLTHANEEQLHIIHAALGNKDVTQKQLRSVQKVLEDVDSREYVRHEAVRDARAAQAVLDGRAGWDEQGKMFLTELLEYIINRES